MEGKKLYKSRTDRKVAGVCAGLGEYLGLDTTIVRLCWILGTVFTVGCVGVIAYLIFAAVIPDAPVDM